MEASMTEYVAVTTPNTAAAAPGRPITSAVPSAVALPAAEHAASEEMQLQQQSPAGLSPISMPASMLLPVQAGAAAGTSPQRLKYASEAAAYESDMEDELAGNSSMGISDSAALLQYSMDEQVLAATAAANTAESADSAVTDAARPSASAAAAVDEPAALPLSPAADEPVDNVSNAADGGVDLLAQDTSASAVLKSAPGAGTMELAEKAQISLPTAANPQQQTAAAPAVAAEAPSAATSHPAAATAASIPKTLGPRRRSRVGEGPAQPSSQPAAVAPLPHQQQQQQQQQQNTMPLPAAAPGSSAPWLPAAAPAAVAAAAVLGASGADSSLATELSRLRPIRTTATDTAAGSSTAAAAAGHAAPAVGSAAAAAGEGKAAGGISRWGLCRVVL
jgi:hypothetical protein